MTSRFTTTQLKQALVRARGESATWAEASYPRRYANLAFVSLNEDSEYQLTRLKNWPVGVYNDASKGIRIEVIAWLIENSEQIGFIEKRNAWIEQWQLAAIALQPPDNVRAEQIARSMRDRNHSNWGDRLFDALEEHQATPTIALSRLRYLRNGTCWWALIDHATDYLDRYDEPTLRRACHLLLAEALLEAAARGHEAMRDGLSAGERAWHVLVDGAREGLQGPDFERVMERAIEASLPEVLTEGRAEPTSIIGDAGRGLSRLGRGIGRLFGGREATVPSSDGVIASAPALLAAGQVESALNDSERHARALREAVGGSVSDHEGAVTAGALTAGGLWTLAQIDDSVLDAISFSSAGNPEGFWQLRDIARTMDGSAGATTRLSGYVAEQQVAIDLARNGHMVEFPDTASQPGYDLLVDGHAVQVKCTESVDAVLAHLETYPDIPVIVNAELADELGDHPMVWVDQALSHAAINDATDATVEALADFGDADDLLPIPLLSVAFAAWRNYGDLEAGRIETGEFAGRVGVDAGARAVGGGAGGLIGGAIGSFLGPAGTAIGSGLGAYVGSVAGGTGADRINREAACDARDVVVKELAQFASWFSVNLLQPRAQTLQARRAEVAHWARRASADSWAPSYVAALNAVAHEAEKRAVELQDWFKSHRRDEFNRTQAGWVALREARHFLHPELKVRLSRVKATIDAYQRATGVAPSGGSSPQPA